ncbi:MAG TPA: hypothetical protein PKA68_09530, partial [Arachnia sp.]|nr:hypothetical protein [Arachnia sp.]
VTAKPGDLEAQRDLSVSLIKVGNMLAGQEPEQALELFLRSLEIRRELSRVASSIQSLEDQGLAAALAAQLQAPSSEARWRRFWRAAKAAVLATQVQNPSPNAARQLWQEAATCLAKARSMAPDDPSLAQQAWFFTSEYLRCQPDDTADWQPLVDHLAERFGFE